MNYGFSRVSTSGQARNGNSLEDQTRQLTLAGAEQIISETVSGAKKRDDRIEFKDLCEKLTSGDTLIVTKLDRLSRSITEGNKIINELLDKGVTVHILNMGILDNSINSKMMRNMLLTFAEFERDMILERCKTGKEIARQKKGYREGRKPKFKPAQINHAMELLESNSYAEVERMIQISVSTLKRHRRKLNSKKEIEEMKK